FQQLYPVGDYATSNVLRRYARPGYGVPLVVRRTQHTGRYCEEAFLTNDATFAATAMLFPQQAACADASTPIPTQATLALYDPLNPPALDSGGGASPLATDTTAPLAFGSISRGDSDFWLTAFIEPDDFTDDRLAMLEPYQPGKIPVIFVHGLLSSPSTWTDLVNDLRAQSEFSQRYQVWEFRYETGAPFLAAAARLRRELKQLITTIDPHGADPALQDIVLVGHSMGGLVARLQTVDSGDALWNVIANEPLEQIVTDPATRAQLAELFFFEAQPSVRRVIYLATPHLGSEWANRPIGRLASSLVRREPQIERRHRQLAAANPGVFSPEIRDRIPTSIDMLDPDSPSLRAIWCLPTAPWITTHSVIGTEHPPLFVPPGDSVVSVESAEHPGTVSRVFVCATHTHVQRDTDTTNEVWRILSEHVASAPEPNLPSPEME
ncbi:MAG: alpha/beta fold hydrolase, partial [Planctomycetales bacterium]|nr:alpha/beta fold hydrolase [Planctomycetales bacterium]